MNVVSCVFSCADFLENVCMERVNPGEKVYFAYFHVRVGDQDKS